MDFDYPAVLDLFPEHRDPRRSESAAFLIWYLENYYRVDSQEAVYSVCDQSGDRGIDGIYVDDDLQIIYVFQASISQRNRAVGDVRLKEFAGTLLQLSDSDSVQELINSSGDAHVGALLKRLEIIDKIGQYELRGEFLSNVSVDANGLAYLRQADNISFIGRDFLQSNFISNQRDVPISTPVSFDVSSFQITEYIVDTDSKAFIAPIRARELVRLNGIANQTIFTHNVRGPLGSTKVNRDIVKSISDPTLHKKFPLIHNGITVLAGSIDLSDDRLTVSDYFVVNGCQSLMALYTHEKSLTDNLHVLTKFIRVDPQSSLAKQITEYSNNQNGVRPRDFKANSAPQIRLQNEFKMRYTNEYGYEIKRGEENNAGTVISNEDAGLYLMAFDLKEPWGTHRKYQIFDEKHAALFARPTVTADRIVMLQIVREEIDKVTQEHIQDSLFGKYVLTRYLLMYVLSEILDADTFGRQVTANPSGFIPDPDRREILRSCIRTVLNDVVIDLNAEVKEYGEDFDYRGRLRDEDWVKGLGRTLVAGYQKQVNRGRVESFERDWMTREQA